MAAPKNLFRLRTAEQAQGDDQFIALFSSRVIELFREREVWDRLLQIESAPGGGKTSLLRLFTPGPLLRIRRLRDRGEYQELFRALSELEVVDSSSVKLLGVYVPCHHDYGGMRQGSEPTTDQRSLFLSLLDARVTLHVLQAACQLAGLKFPQDVATITFRHKVGQLPAGTHDDELGASQLYEVARSVEAEITRSINQLGVTQPLAWPAVSRLDFPLLLSTHDILVDGRELVSRVLLMFDDVHTLAPEQQGALEAELRRHDLSVSRWTATRLSALTPAAVMSEPGKSGREDNGPPIRLDTWNRAVFERWLTDVAYRRAIRADPSIQSFQSLLADRLALESEIRLAEAAAESERSTALKLAQPHAELFRAWTEATEEAARKMDAAEAATEWARLSILIERRLRRTQGEFDFASLSTGELENSPTDLLSAARLFAAKRNRLPYYFGAATAAQLGSWNVEQFLTLAGDLFEVMVNAGSFNRSGLRELSALQQDRVVRASSKAMLANIRRDVPLGGDVHNLIMAFGRFAEAQTYRPTAPYLPGVTGFAISMRDRDELLAAQSSQPEELSARLLRALHAAVSHNVLNPRLEIRGKGQSWMVLYVNRLLCPELSLPLGYGGYREQTLTELKHWLVNGTPTERRQLKLP